MGMTKLHITIQDNEHRDDLNNEDSRDNTSTHLAIPTNTDPILLPQPQVLKTGAYTAQDGDRVCGGEAKTNKRAVQASQLISDTAAMAMFMVDHNHAEASAFI